MITDALNAVVKALENVGVRATVDPPKINPPGAWVAGARLGTAFFGGRYAVEVDVWLIVRDTGIPDALRVLDGLLSDTLDAAQVNGWEIQSSDLAQNVTLPQGGGSLPAYRLTLNVDDY